MMNNIDIHLIKVKDGLQNLTKEEYLEWSQEMVKVVDQNDFLYFFREEEPENIHDVCMPIIKRIISKRAYKNSITWQTSMKSRLTLNDVSDDIIGKIASVLAQKDYFQFIKCNKRIFIKCNNPHQLRSLDLRFTTFPNKIAIFHNVEHIFLNIKQVPSLCDDNENKTITNLSIKTLGLYDISKESFCINHLKKQKLINLKKIERIILCFHGRHTQTRQVFFGRTLIELLTIIPAVNELTIRGWIGTLEGMCWNYALPTIGHPCSKSLKKLKICCDQPSLLNILLKTNKNSLTEVTFADNGTQSVLAFGSHNDNEKMTKFVYSKLEKIEIINVTSHIILNVIKSVPNAKRIRVTIVSFECEFNNDLYEWKYIMREMMNLKHIEKITIACDNYYIQMLTEGIIDGLKIIKESKPKIMKKVKMVIIIKTCKQSTANNNFNITLILDLILQIKKKHCSPYYQLLIEFICQDLKEKQAYDAVNGYNWHKYDVKICETCHCYFEKDDKLLSCNACPRCYHVDCLQPTPKAMYYENIVWYCPVCAPVYERIPLQFKIDNSKWPHINEPLLINSKAFLKKHPYLEHDLTPNRHETLLRLKRIDRFETMENGMMIKSKVVDHYIGIIWGRKFD